MNHYTAQMFDQIDPSAGHEEEEEFEIVELSNGKFAVIHIADLALV